MNAVRERIFRVIEIDKTDDKLSHIYDISMMAVIILSLVPLAFKETYTVITIIDIVTSAVFIVDYLLRLFTADLKLKIRKPLAFAAYPFTPMALIDLAVILSSLSVLGSAFRVLKVLRLMRTFRVLRAVKLVRYSKSLIIVIDVLKKERKSLTAVATLAVAYIFISALLVFSVEPDSFGSFFEAVYWATKSLTPVGYGDIYPTSTLGRVVTMVSSVFGIAIIALPSGIITGGYMKEVDKYDDDNDEEDEEKGRNG